MTKIKELLAGREKLAKYDELTEWKEFFKSVDPKDLTISKHGCISIDLPDYIKQIIVSALDAEIAKLDEE